MSDTTPNPHHSPASGYASTEEMIAAQAANEADALSRVQGELATLQAKSAELADQYLRAKAEAENARRRAEEEISKARKFALESFAESLLPVLDSFEADKLMEFGYAGEKSGDAIPFSSLLCCTPAARSSRAFVLSASG